MSTVLDRNQLDLDLTSKQNKKTIVIIFSSVLHRTLASTSPEVSTSQLLLPYKKKKHIIGGLITEIVKSASKVSYMIHNIFTLEFLRQLYILCHNLSTLTGIRM